MRIYADKIFFYFQKQRKINPLKSASQLNKKSRPPFGRDSFSNNYETIFIYFLIFFLATVFFLGVAFLAIISFTAACAAARRAIGTRKGEQLT